MSKKTQSKAKTQDEVVIKTLSKRQFQKKLNEYFSGSEMASNVSNVELKKGLDLVQNFEDYLKKKKA